MTSTVVAVGASTFQVASRALEPRARTIRPAPCSAAPGPSSARLGQVSLAAGIGRRSACVRVAAAETPRAVDFMPNDNTDVFLDTVSEEMLFQALGDEEFLTMVRDQWCSTKGPDECPAEIEPMGAAKLFVPVPWSRETRFGMPKHFEKYRDHPDFCIINIPPNFLISANIFKPSKLATVFQRVGAEEPPEEEADPEQN